MNKPINHQDEIFALAGQLEKLLKVINHSDPSAKQMKVMLYKKYQDKLSQLATSFKAVYSWSGLLEYLTRLKNDKEVPIDLDTQDIVFSKIIKDFEEAFVTRHELSELTPPDPIDSRQKRRISNIRKQIRTNRKSQPSQTPAESLYDMMQYKHQQKSAKSSLDKLIKAINKANTNTNNQLFNPKVKEEEWK